jgi:hypothetical protein
MIFSINRIEKLFKKFCTEQEPNYLRTYKVGNFLDAISEKKTQYPIAVVDFLDGNFDKLQTNISIVVTIGDRVLNDESNVYEVFSNNLQVGRDLYTFLNQYKEQFAITSASYRRFLEKSGDMLAGYVFTFQLKILDIECAYEVPIVELECLDAHLTINEIPTLTLVSGETKSISVTLDGNPSGTFNEETQTWEVESDPCPPTEITFTFDNNLIAVVDTSPYNIDCSTEIDIVIVSDSRGLDGLYSPDGMLNDRNIYYFGSNSIFYNDTNWVIQGSGSENAAAGDEAYPWLATWGISTVTQGTISEYCGGGVCADATYEIKDSANTTLYSGSIVSGGNLDQTITDSVATLKDSAGTTISTTNILAEGSENITAPDGAVTVNSDAFGNVKSNGSLNVPVEYVNGTPVGSIVSGVVQIPNPIVPSGIAYQRPSLTGQTTSYRTGDDAWHLTNGTYTYVPPPYPTSFARLDMGSVSPFTTLFSNNAFGNTDRFTDDAGGQTYANDYVIDHLTGLGYYRIVQGASTDWDTNIDNAEVSVLLGFTDWRVCNFQEYDVIGNRSMVGFNYAPFSLTGSPISVFQTSTTRNDLTTHYIRYQISTFIQQASELKTTALASRGVLFCRNHY